MIPKNGAATAINMTSTKASQWAAPGSPLYRGFRRAIAKRRKKYAVRKSASYRRSGPTICCFPVARCCLCTARALGKLRAAPQMFRAAPQYARRNARPGTSNPQTVSMANFWASAIRRSLSLSKSNAAPGLLKYFLSFRPSDTLPTIAHTTQLPIASGYLDGIGSAPISAGVSYLKLRIRTNDRTANVSAAMATIITSTNAFECCALRSV